MIDVIWLTTSNIEDVSAMYGKKKNGYLGVVYAIEYGEHLKIGSTSNPLQRMKSLRASSKNYGTIEIKRMMISMLHTNYRDNERLFHSKYKDKRVRAELFDLTFENFNKNKSELIFLDDTEKMKARTDYVVGQLKNFITGESSIISIRK